mgnify:CR=1 FL=1
MITQIKGKLVEKTPTHVVVDCNGIGYEVNISLEYSYGEYLKNNLIGQYICKLNSLLFMF